MVDSSRVLVIGEDTFLKGEVRNGGRIEIYGYVEGDVAGDLLVVQPGGRCFGTVTVESADIHGTLQGDIAVKQLITVRTGGSVTGNVNSGSDSCVAVSSVDSGASFSSAIVSNRLFELW